MTESLTTDQILLFAILLLVFACLIWGRFRYDLVAFGALIVALVVGVVPSAEAFAGFGHPATVVVALVLIVSRGLSNAGVVELVASKVVDATRPLFLHIGLMAGVSAVLSAVMNNVAALALLMPVDLEAAAKAKRSPALTLMPLSFASILGGLVTLIGTPPNIIIATFREESLGEPFAMFDFAPVGAACALAGVVFVALIGWRLIPKARVEQNAAQELFALQDYVAELKVPDMPEEPPAGDAGIDAEAETDIEKETKAPKPPKAPSPPKAVGMGFRDLEKLADETEVQLLALERDGLRRPVRYGTLRAGDLLIVQAGPEAIEKFAGALKLDYVDTTLGPGEVAGKDLSLMEVVVPRNAPIEGRSVLSLGLLRRHEVHLVGVAREGRRFRERLRRLTIQAGDVLLLLGDSQRLGDAVQRLGGLPLAERGLQLIRREKAGLAVAIFALAIALASFGVLYLPVALAAVVAFFALTGIVPLRELYHSVEWPVIVLLGSLIPIGSALESSGGTALIAGGLVTLSEGYSAVVVLTLLMIITMTLSDVLNNTATAVIAAPIALDVANRLNVNPDPFLMAVAVAASCAFLTPIGHKNNTLIMGPGGYRFGDYWRMGLPLEILVVAVGVPMILLVWPL